MTSINAEKSPALTQSYTSLKIMSKVKATSANEKQANVAAFCGFFGAITQPANKLSTLNVENKIHIDSPPFFSLQFTTEAYLLTNDINAL